MENKKIRRLPDAELEIMFVIWGMNEPVNAKAVLKEMKRPWALATLMTVLSRLCEKGFLTCEKVGHNNFYTSAVNIDEYKKLEASSFLEKVYAGDIVAFVDDLRATGSVSDDKLAELSAYLAK